MITRRSPLPSFFDTVHACPATGACTPPVDHPRTWMNHARDHLFQADWGTDGALVSTLAWTFGSSTLGSVPGLLVWKCAYTQSSKHSMIGLKSLSQFIDLVSSRLSLIMLPVKHQKCSKICLYPPDYLFSENEGYIYTSVRYSECIIVLCR